MIWEVGEVEVGGYGVVVGFWFWLWYCWRVVVDEDDGFGFVMYIGGDNGL